MIIIHKPIWRKDTGRRCVGIAEYRLRCEGTITEIEIDYTNKEGERIYPNKFCIATEKVYWYPVRWAKNNVKLYIVPIEDLRELEKKTIKTENTTEG